MTACAAYGVQLLALVAALLPAVRLSVYTVADYRLLVALALLVSLSTFTLLAARPLRGGPAVALLAASVALALAVVGTHTLKPTDSLHAAGRQRPAPMAQGSCVAQRDGACAVCRAGGGAGGRGQCKRAYGWNWTADPQVNELSTSIAGLRIVRGLEALAEPDVATVATWRQSNWPAHVRAGRGAHAVHKRRLCSMWRGANWYHSWPIALDCPGWGSREFEREPQCGTTTAIFRLSCAYMDFSAAAQGEAVQVPGSIYDATRWFRLDQSRTPPNVCAGSAAEPRVVRLEAFGTSVGVNAPQVAHWVSEQLPVVLLLHDALPAGVPILVVDSPAARRYLRVLVDLGVLPAERLWFESPASLADTTFHAAHLYVAASSYFSFVIAGDRNARRVRSAFAPALPWWLGLEPAPKYVLLLNRGNEYGLPRSIANNKGVVQSLRRAIRGASRPAARALTLYGSGRRLPWQRATEDSKVGWSPALRPRRGLAQDVAIVRRAALIVAPHGAGLVNILFASPGAAVIEICFDNDGARVREPSFPKGLLNLSDAGLPLSPVCPDMLVMLGLNLGLDYSVVSASGTTFTPMLVHLPMLEEAAGAALERCTLRWPAAAHGAEDCTPQQRGPEPREWARQRGGPQPRESGGPRTASGASTSRRSAAH